MAQSKETIQSVLQVDLDLSRVKEKVAETNRIEDQADRRAEEIKRKAKEALEGLEAGERRSEAALHRFGNKVVEDPLKKLGKASIGMLAADIVSGFEGGEGDVSFLKKAGRSALFAAPAGPAAAAIAVLGAAVEQLIESVKDSKREETEIKKKLLEEQQRRREENEEFLRRIEQIELDREIDRVRFQTKVELIARELDYQTFTLMGTAED